MKVMFAAVGSEIISIEALSAILKQHGHECTLAFDRGLFDDKQYFSIPFLSKILSDKKQVIRDIIHYQPDLLAFSVFADNYQWCLDIARTVKKTINVPVIMGGVHPTSVPDTCIAEDCVDIICLGEGEYPLLELLESLKNRCVDYSIKNLWFKKDGEIIKNNPRSLMQNLDTLPLLDKELFKKYIPISDYYLTVTNKGCIATCSYCSQNFYAHWEKENNLSPFYRERSVESVISELKIMKERYNYKRVDIKNNILAASGSWTLEFLERYKKGIGVPLRIMGHPKTITPGIAAALKEAGCWHVQIGIESLNPCIRRKVLNRQETNEEIYHALNALDDAGLNYSVDVMVGLPGEKDEDVLQAIEFLSERKHMIRASIFWLEYFPEVDITKYALRNCIINEKYVTENINQGLQKNYLSTGSVVADKKKCNLLNFQILFRALPILPSNITKFILRKKLYIYFKYLPQIPVIIAADLLVSIIRKDQWALYVFRSYLWEISRRIKRFFNQTDPIEYNVKLIKEINHIYHESEAETYDSNHPEVLEGDILWWKNIASKRLNEARGRDGFKLSILDLGSGTGFVGNTIQNYLETIDTLVCYDLSYNMLLESKKRFKDSVCTQFIFFVQGDAEKLPFSDSTFDVITLNAVLHHLPDYGSCLKEIDRILNKNGLIIISHEQNKKFFTFAYLRLFAELFKMFGGGKKITDYHQAHINEHLKKIHLVKRDLSKTEIIKMVDFHSPAENSKILIDKNKGFIAKDIISDYFCKYKILQVQEYSTFF